MPFLICMIIIHFACTMAGQNASAPENECSYTFRISKQNGSCPAVLSDSEARAEDVEYLKSIIQNQQDQLSMLTRNMLHQEDKIAKLEALQQSVGNKENVTYTVGTNYVRWGRTTCPDTAVLLYEGKILMYRMLF